jgi:DNA-binding GntR family transcriptional regulator
MIETALLVFLSINSSSSPRTRKLAAAEHAEIVDAIESRDKSAAAQAMLHAIDAGHVHAKQAQRERRRPRPR